MQNPGAALHTTDRGTVICIEVTAGSRRNAFPAGFNPWRNTVGCHVTAPAVGGKANRAVVDLIAESLGIPRARVSIISGSASSGKKVLAEGAEIGTVAAFLKARI
jgi:uncharacterized protein (TIGR00251 family)